MNKHKPLNVLPGDHAVWNRGRTHSFEQSPRGVCLFFFWNLLMSESLTKYLILSVENNKRHF